MFPLHKVKNRFQQQRVTIYWNWLILIKMKNSQSAETIIINAIHAILFDKKSDVKVQQGFLSDEYLTDRHSECQLWNFLLFLS